MVGRKLNVTALRLAYIDITFQTHKMSNNIFLFIRFGCYEWKDTNITKTHTRFSLQNGESWLLN